MNTKFVTYFFQKKNTPKLYLCVCDKYVYVKISCDERYEAAKIETIYIEIGWLKPRTVTNKLTTSA